MRGRGHISALTWTKWKLIKMIKFALKSWTCPTNVLTVWHTADPFSTCSPLNNHSSNSSLPIDINYTKCWVTLLIHYITNPGLHPVGKSRAYLPTFWSLNPGDFSPTLWELPRLPRKAPKRVRECPFLGEICISPPLLQSNFRETPAKIRRVGKYGPELCPQFCRLLLETVTELTSLS